MSYPSGFSFNEGQGPQQFPSNSYSRGMEMSQDAVYEDGQPGRHQYPSGGRDPMLLNPMVGAIAETTPAPQHFGYPSTNEYLQEGMSPQAWTEKRMYFQTMTGATQVSTSGRRRSLDIIPYDPEKNGHGRNQHSELFSESNQPPVLPSSSMGTVTSLHTSAYPYYLKPESHRPFTSSVGNDAPHLRRTHSRIPKTSYQSLPEDFRSKMGQDTRGVHHSQPCTPPEFTSVVYEGAGHMSRPGDPIQCPYTWCSSTFTRSGDLERHLATASMHNPMRTGGSDSSKRCRKCGEEFSRPDARNRHELKNSCGKRKHTARRTSQQDLV